MASSSLKKTLSTLESPIATESKKMNNFVVDTLPQWAHLALRIMYKKGEGGPMTRSEAEKQLSVAAASGSKFAKSLLQDL